MIDRRDFEAEYASAFRTLLSSKNHPAFIRFLYVHNPLEASETRLSGSRDYYIFEEDKRALALLRQRHAGVFDQTRAIVDLGPGDPVAAAHKVGPFLALPVVELYCAVDGNPLLFDAIRNQLSTTAPGIAFEAHPGDFLEDPLAVPRLPRALYLMLGNTIGDLPLYSSSRSGRESLLRYLAQLRGRVPTSSHLIVSMDTATDPQKILRAYQSELTISFLQRGLDWLAGHDPELRPVCAALRPDIGYDEASSCVVFGYRASVAIPDGKGHDRLEAGERVVAGVSYRFPADVFAGCLEAAGFAVKDSAAGPGDTVRVFLAA